MLFDIDDFRDTGHRLLLDDAEAGGRSPPPGSHVAARLGEAIVGRLLFLLRGTKVQRNHSR